MGKSKDIESVVTDKRECMYCGNPYYDIHHCLEGAYRNTSVKYGIWIPLCRLCHTRVHKHETEMQKIRVMGQRKAMEHYGWSLEEWMEKVGRNFNG